MSTIGGPGGIGGPKGPAGPNRLEHAEASDGPERARETEAAPHVAGTPAPAAGTAAQPTTPLASPANLDRVAADLRSGRLTPHEAVDRLVADVVDVDAMTASDQAELRELMTDLLAHDPHLAALVGRLG